MFRGIDHYYRSIKSRMQFGGVPPLVPRHNRVIIPVLQVNRGMIQVLKYALGAVARGASGLRRGRTGRNRPGDERPGATP